jgi:GMP synthase-like glutamine amidotransferase
MSRVLAIRHHVEDSPGLIGDAFVARGYAVDVAMMDAEHPTPDLAGYDALVILGSTHAVYDDEIEAAWFGRELDLIAAAQRRAVPVLGICFGAQALCRYHGGEVSASDEPEVGWYEVEPTPGSPLEAGPWFEYHFDRCTLPATAQVWATTPAAVQAFVVGADLGVQFHPEIDDVQLAQWLAGGDEGVRAVGHDPVVLLERTRSEAPAARDRAQRLVDVFVAHATSRARS